MAGEQALGGGCPAGGLAAHLQSESSRSVRKVSD